MKSVMNLSIAFLLGFSNLSNAQDLSVHLWEKRPVLVFADDDNDADYYKQMKMLNAYFSALQERDIVIYGDNLSSLNTSLRRQYKPSGFTVFLIGKDGGVKLKRNTRVSARELFSLIDAMPTRQREMQNQN